MPYRENSEVPGLWRADNVATPDQIEEVSEQLITPDHLIAEAPLIYVLPGTEECPHRTLSVISNCDGKHKRDSLSLISVSIQEQTHLLISQAERRQEPFFTRRTVFEIGLEVECRPEGKVPADSLYLKQAHYDTTSLRQIESEMGDRVLSYIRWLRAGRQDFDAVEAMMALQVSRKTFLSQLRAIQERAPFGVAEYDEAKMLLMDLRQRGEPLKKRRRIEYK